MTDKEFKKEITRFALRHASVIVPAAAGLVVFSADQLFKDSVEKRPDDIFPHAVSKKLPALTLRKLHNDGFALGVGKNHPKLTKAAPLLSTGLLAGMFAAKPGKNVVETIGGSVLLAGAASNIYDRFKKGYVVDYLHVNKGPLGKIVFNLGDAAIAAGALGSLAGLVPPKKHKPHET